MAHFLRCMPVPVEGCAGSFLYLFMAVAVQIDSERPRARAPPARRRASSCVVRVDVVVVQRTCQWAWRNGRDLCRGHGHWVKVARHAPSLVLFMTCRDPERHRPALFSRQHCTITHWPHVMLTCLDTPVPLTLMSLPWPKSIVDQLSFPGHSAALGIPIISGILQNNKHISASPFLITRKKLQAVWSLKLEF